MNIRISVVSTESIFLRFLILFPELVADEQRLLHIHHIRITIWWKAPTANTLWKCHLISFYLFFFCSITLDNGMCFSHPDLCIFVLCMCAVAQHTPLPSFIASLFCFSSFLPSCFFVYIRYPSYFHSYSNKFEYLCVFHYAVFSLRVFEGKFPAFLVWWWLWV